MSINISSGFVRGKQKVVVYGPEGIGKSTFATKFPNPLFIDTEGSTNALDVRRFTDKPTSWSMLLEYIDYVKNNPGICDTLVIDTIDWAERLCVESILNAHGKKGIEDFGYGNGYTYVAEEIGRFLNRLQELVDKQICNVVLTAHCQMKKFEQPNEMGAYDRWELKLGKKTTSQTSPLVKEWADMILFANYETFAVKIDDKGKKYKGQGGSRVMYTTHHPCWDAKNRCGLPDKLPFDYAQIAHIFNNSPASTAPAAPAPQPTINTPIENAPTQNNTQTAPVQNNAPGNTSAPPGQAASAAQSNSSAPPTQPAPQANAAPSQGTLPPIDLSDFEEVGTDPAALVIPDNIPQALKDLMKANSVSEEEIRLAVSNKGYFPLQTPIQNYPEDFILGCLVACWEQVFGIIQSNRVPF